VGREQGVGNFRYILYVPPSRVMRTSHRPNDKIFSSSFTRSSISSAHSSPQVDSGSKHFAGVSAPGHMPPCPGHRCFLRPWMANTKRVLSNPL
jgi:hypothetical protein